MKHVSMMMIDKDRKFICDVGIWLEDEDFKKLRLKAKELMFQSPCMYKKIDRFQHLFKKEEF